MSPVFRPIRRAPDIVAQTPVITGTKRLTVSTIRIARDNAETVVFDDHSDKRHDGWFIDGFTINKSSKRAENRDDAMETHR
ncbi:hypothetical protein KBZ21_36045, partial [Streptomyces sp. A73]|nr:hypothetical protein [Streptomyces sp. A73]